MFTLGITGLIASYVMLAVLLLSINLYSNWSWPVKAGTIILTTCFYIVSFFSLPPLLGWPTSAELPQKFKLIAAEVTQPNKTTGAEGAIYLWLTEVDDLNSSRPPRAYKLTYSDLLHEQVLGAKIKLGKGVQQLGEKKEPDSEVDELSETKTTQTSIEIEFYDLPDPLFPEK